MTIEVTQEDIDSGIKESTCECPVALAISRQFNGETIAVCFIKIYKDNRQFANIPIDVQKFILKFDSGFHVEPFSFELEI